MKKLIVGCVVISALVCTAEGTNAEVKRTRRPTAGMVVQPGSQKGVFSIISTQSELAKGEIEKVAAQIEDALMIKVEVTEEKPGDPAEQVKAAKGRLGVVVTSDEKTPALLLAPEDGWGVVNVRKLDQFATQEAKVKFFATRCRREIARAFVGVAGGLFSTYPDNMMDTTDIATLEMMPDDIPYDKIISAQKFLKAYGYAPLRRVPYGKACREGWAPAPTNDLQKAVWEKVHAPPSKPIKITYDKDKQKPVVK